MIAFILSAYVNIIYHMSDPSSYIIIPFTKKLSLRGRAAYGLSLYFINAYVILMHMSFYYQKIFCWLKIEALMPLISV